ncbi:MAG: sigma-70 family RNA polymerase sigma factor [Pirellula sp.]
MPPSHPETRASLILRLQDSADVTAWDEFVGIYSPVVSRVATRLGLQPADADNVVQEVMLRVARSVSHWLDRQDRGSFRAWLQRIAKNETVNLLTRRATRPFAQSESSGVATLENLVDQNSLSSDLDLEYEREVFLWAAEQVRESVAVKTWQAFWLTHVEGQPIEEVANQLGVRSGNIYFGRCRVMNRLKQLIQQFEEK